MSDYFGKEVPKLGFGLMRLPHKGVRTDIEQTKKMVDLFLAAGFTYFDTSFVYLGSEAATKKALVDRHPRESYTLCTKLNTFNPAGTDRRTDDKRRANDCPLQTGILDIRLPRQLTFAILRQHGIRYRNARNIDQALYVGLLGSGNDIARSTGIDALKGTRFSRKEYRGEMVHQIYADKGFAD